MKKTVLFVVLLVVTQLALAGGIVTNSNQSAQYIRSLSRNASTDIDAVYYNPAGLTQLSNGWHLALYNQTIFQEKKVTNNFATIADKEYIGKVNVPIYPDIYAVYKMDKLALSFGFGPNAGGGTAEFEDGLPSFELPVSQMPALISGMGIPTTGYKADMYFKGSSVFYGFQLNASYAISDMVSVAVGARYILAQNNYEGYLKNIQINPTFPALGLDGSYMSAIQFFNALSTVNPAAGAYVAKVADVDVDAEQSGSAITPMIGLYLKPSNKFNIGLKYELNTALELENKTAVDGSGMFPDGFTFRNDIPAILALGGEYLATDKLSAQLSFTYYFDKDADWNGREEWIDKNLWELGIGLEYNLSEALLISGGFLRTETGVKENYQSDMSNSLSSNTVGVGLRYTLSQALDLDFGLLYTAYEERQKSVLDQATGATMYTEFYNRSNIAFALGLGYHL